MKNFCIKLGSIIATLLMFSPLYIIINYDNVSYPIFWLICSILYDIYMYKIISNNS